MNYTQAERYISKKFPGLKLYFGAALDSNTNKHWFGALDVDGLWEESILVEVTHRDKIYKSELQPMIEQLRKYI